MEANPGIDASMSVREVLRRYPATRAVFDQYGLFGCGGEEGPTEPLSLFARVHQANPEDLLEQLRRAASGESVPSTSATPSAASVHLAGTPSSLPGAPPTAKDPRNLSRAFLRTALLTVITGGGFLGTVLLALVSYYGS